MGSRTVRRRRATSNSRVRRYRMIPVRPQRPSGAGGRARRDIKQMCNEGSNGHSPKQIEGQKVSRNGGDLTKRLYCWHWYRVFVLWVYLINVSGIV